GKQGRTLNIKRSARAGAANWFEKRGGFPVLVAPLLPTVRTFISLPAGVAKMPFWRFTLFTVIGCIPWVLMLTLIGKAAGDNWEKWKDKLHYVDYTVAVLIVVGIVYLVVKWRRGKSSATEPEPESV